MSFKKYALLVLLATASVCHAGEYEDTVKPILKARCYACHGALKQEASLRVDAVTLMTEGGDSGSAIVAGQPDKSLLIERVSAQHEDERMPPEGKPLTSAEIVAIRDWIERGAVAPVNDEPEPDPITHWAFRPPMRTALKVEPRATAFSRTDAILQQDRDAQGLVTVNNVSRDLLLRRIYIDLVGLPPARNNVSRFVNDERPDAYERVVDQLLASPQHGERWGRHWMDIWRYTDWYGLGKQLRNSQKHIWHWRDWIVESLNAGMGYDEMLRLMLAADELEPTNRDALRATGFLARNYYLFNRDTWLDETIEHTSKAFMGLTMNCCKCHDHKYDPLLQTDYYAFRAIFEPHQVRLDPIPGSTDLEVDGLPRVFDAHLEVPTYLHIRGDTKNPDKENPLTASVPNVVRRTEWQPIAVELPAEAYRPSLQLFVLEDHLRQAEQAIERATVKLKEAEARVKRSKTMAGSSSVVYTHVAFDDALPWSDDFAEPRPKMWRIGKGTWKHADGDVQQTESGQPRRYIRSVMKHPPNFVAQLSFTTTGGDRWRSVGVCFDVDSGHEKMVYMSAVRPGSKLQYSFGKDGQQSYPVVGRVVRDVKVNQRYVMTIAVRGNLLNVAINGKHALAYTMAEQRREGMIDITAFDAQVTFHDFRLRTLTDDVRLVAAGEASDSITPEVATAMLEVASSELDAAKRKPRALQSAFAADRIKHGMQDGEVASAVNAAARAAREYEYASAAVAVEQAKLSIVKAPDEAAKKKAQTEIAKAKAALEKTRAAIEKPGEQYVSITASSKAAEGPAETDESRKKPYPTKSSGRRTAFARWLTSRENPLAARVAANHIWLRHFGQPLVDPVNDFGLRAKQPVQQALLDELAVELMESGWDMKHLHRRLVSSSTYRLESSTVEADPQTVDLDPANAYYWRRMPVRMESQVVRDSLLHLADSLDSELGGPTIKPQQKNSTPRRSLYFTRSRDDHDAFLKMFDDADILRCYRRSQSIVPQQALAMANSELALQMSRTLAIRIRESLDESDELDSQRFVVKAFHWILCREPSSDEREACTDALRELRTAAASKSNEERQRRAEANLVHALLNHNDFITVR